MVSPGGFGEFTLGTEALDFSAKIDYNLFISLNRGEKMNYYSIILDGPSVQEAVLYTASNRLGQILRWAGQYQQGQISVQLLLDMDSVRILPMAYIVDRPETTLDELFGKQATG